MFDKKLNRIYKESDGISLIEAESLAALAAKDTTARKQISTLISEWEGAAKKGDRKAMRKAVKNLVSLVPEPPEDDDDEDSAPLCRYTVNVHYDAVATVVVEARDEDEAIELAEAEAEGLDASEFDFDATESCVTNVKEI